MNNVHFLTYRCTECGHEGSWVCPRHPGKVRSLKPNHFKPFDDASVDRYEFDGKTLRKIDKATGK